MTSVADQADFLERLTGWGKTVVLSQKRKTPTLTAEFQALKQLLVLLEVMPLDIIEKLAPATGHGDQAAATVKVLAVGPQVVSEVGDALREQGDLDFRRTGVGFVTLEVCDNG